MVYGERWGESSILDDLGALVDKNFALRNFSQIFFFACCPARSALFLTPPRSEEITNTQRGEDGSEREPFYNRDFTPVFTSQVRVSVCSFSLYF